MVAIAAGRSAMVIALNLFDIIPGKEAMYAEYLRRVRPILERHHAHVLFYGRTRARFLGSCDQEYCGIIAYGDPTDLARFSHDPEFTEIKSLRDDSTRNYVLMIAEEIGLAEAALGLSDECHERHHRAGRRGDPAIGCATVHHTAMHEPCGGGRSMGVS